MEGFLSMDNILSGDEAANLFLDNNDEEAPDKEEAEKKEETQDTNETTEVTPDTLFDEEEPESVGSGKKDKQGKEDTSSEKDGTSPNFYSSIASALKEEGVFPDLDDEETDKITSPEEFRDLVERQIQAGLEERQQRIYTALNAGVEPNVIKQYENTMNYLNSITKEQLSDESTQGEQLRRQLLQQDFMNRGYSNERAVKMTEKLFASGEDIEEAIQALDGNKQYFGSRYDAMLQDAENQQKREAQERKKQQEALKKDILESDNVFGKIPLDKKTRQAIYDNISKLKYKNEETGQQYTALQKYRLENANDFIKNVGILFTLTDGFKNIDKLIAPSAKKEVKSKLRELEHTINNTQRDSGGKLNYIGGISINSTVADNMQDFSIDI